MLILTARHPPLQLAALAQSNTSCNHSSLRHQRVMEQKVKKPFLIMTAILCLVSIQGSDASADEPPRICSITVDDAPDCLALKMKEVMGLDDDGLIALTYVIEVINGCPERVEIVETHCTEEVICPQEIALESQEVGILNTPIEYWMHQDTLQTFEWGMGENSGTFFVHGQCPQENARDPLGTDYERVAEEESAEEESAEERITEKSDASGCAVTGTSGGSSPMIIAAILALLCCRRKRRGHSRVLWSPYGHTIKLA
jgi:hypothetical protein